MVGLIKSVRVIFLKKRKEKETKIFINENLKKPLLNISLSIVSFADLRIEALRACETKEKN